MHFDTQTAACKILAQVATRLVDIPYGVIAHSVGTWIAFEMLARAREEGLPMPMRVFFSCFPAPSMSVHERPWKVRQAPMSMTSSSCRDCADPCQTGTSLNAISTMMASRLNAAAGMSATRYWQMRACGPPTWRS